MFEQLEPQTKEVSTRRNYFIISSVGLVAILFTAIIFSIFAADLDISMGDLEMLELLAPVDVTEQQKLPETDMTPHSKPAGGGPTKAATRQVEMARIDETPREVPAVISTEKNSAKARPDLARFEIGKANTEPVGGNGFGRGNGSGTGDGDGFGDGLGTDDSATAAVKEKEAAAPPPRVTVPAAKPIIQSKGVVNSLATSLPMPSVPTAAKMTKAAGTVTVQVLVDEKGNVIKANAVSGNALLREACEIAARNARFTPTLLSGEAIKISGVINYHFNADGGTD